ncbi:hypothetical protein, partial [Luteitalea sp.]|uniref:hypothetical protein n=1 Tax=Luteitalea sp. TaxID=2004800 RepID=UPI0037C58EB0
AGFALDDVIYALAPSGLDAPNQSVILAFLRSNAHPHTAEDSVHHRLAKARAYLSAPIATAADLVRLVGRGYLGFDAGLLNPGALVHDGQLILVVRGERYTWTKARVRPDLLLGGCQPVLLTLDGHLGITGATPCATPALGAGASHSRAEDFRLFAFRGQLFSNHALVSIREGSARQTTPLHTESLRSSVMVSQLDVAQPALSPIGQPTLDRPTTDNEKNWAFFEHRRELHLIYSFDPYHVLKATNWPSLSFETVISAQVGSPFADRLPIRNSINPVDYSDAAYLHVIHRVYPEKQYVFWAVLLCRQTLRPLAISARPLVRAWQSSPSAIIYVSSLVATAEEVLVFAGLDDSSTACWRIPRSRLDDSWTPWPTAHANTAHDVAGHDDELNGRTYNL